MADAGLPTAIVAAVSDAPPVLLLHPDNLPTVLPEACVRAEEMLRKNPWNSELKRLFAWEVVGDELRLRVGRGRFYDYRATAEVIREGVYRPDLAPGKVDRLASQALTVNVLARTADGYWVIQQRSRNVADGGLWMHTAGETWAWDETTDVLEEVRDALRKEAATDAIKSVGPFELVFIPTAAQWSISTTVLLGITFEELIERIREADESWEAACWTGLSDDRLPGYLAIYGRAHWTEPGWHLMQRALRGKPFAPGEVIP